MITETGVVALFVEANPIPITSDELNSPRSLATSVDTAFDSAEAESDVLRGHKPLVDYLQQRPDESTATARQKAWRGVAVAVAATILVVVGVVVGVVVVAGQSDSTDAALTAGRVEVLPFVGGLKAPLDVVFDPTGGLFISEHLAGQVGRVEILPDGTAGERVVVASGFEDLARLALDENGALYFSDYDAVIRVPDGSAVTWASPSTATRFALGFAAAEGLAIDASGNLYIAHTDDDRQRTDIAEGAEAITRITKVDVLEDDSAGTASEVVAIPGGVWGRDIEFGPTGELFVTTCQPGPSCGLGRNNDNDEIWAVTFGDDGSMTSLRLFASVPGGPRALAFDATGMLFVGTESGTVWSIDPAGQPTVVISGFGSVASMAFDASGTLYLADDGADEGANTVFRIVAK